MKIIYFGNACSKSLESEILKKINLPSIVALNKLERALLKGFNENEIFDIEAHCLPSMNYSILSNSLYSKPNYDKIDENVKTKTYPIIRIPIIKYLVYFFITIYITLKWTYKNRREKKFIFVGNNFVPVTAALVIFSKLLSLNVCLLLCDLSKDMYSKEKIMRFGTFKKAVIPLYYYIIKIIEKNYDFYIFVAESMNTINKKNKPYIVIEGIYEKSDLIFGDEIKKNKQDTFKIIYSGSLYKLFGIEKIIDVFNLISDSKFELYLYGAGDAESDILLAQMNNKNIIYGGFINENELFDKLENANLLINLRNPEDEYTKHSFPSKLFEYMASATPVLTTKLEGIPKEYLDYLYVVDSYDSSIIRDKILEISKKNTEDLKEFGQKSKAFILKNKNPEIQVKKILDKLHNL